MPTSTALAYPNPENKPLGELSFQVTSGDGVVQFVKALDKYWSPRSVFANYLSLISPSGTLKTGHELDEWLHEAEGVRDDLEYLITRRHHIFWSYMVYQKSALNVVVTFLQRSVPFYLDIYTQGPTTQIIDLYKEILNLAIRIICRIITNKESAESWITIEQLRELIYKNYLITVPMLFDLISAVGNADSQNVSILKRIFQTLLSIEPNYKKDFAAALLFYKTAFRSIQTQAENEGFEGAGGGEPDDKMETPYDDVALYTMDCAYSLSVLLDVYPDLCSICDEIKLGQSIAHFYDSCIPFLFKNICLINENAMSLYCINQARIQYLAAFRMIVYAHIEDVLKSPNSCMESAERFIGVLTECLSEQAFVVDYGRRYPIELDIDVLQQTCKDLDTFKSNFVLRGYQRDALDNDTDTIGGKELLMRSQMNDAINIKQVPSTNSTTLESIQTPDQDKSRIKNRDIDMEVATVLEVFPDLGTGFVHRVLCRYDNSEEAIAAILEDNLPPDLVNAERAEVYIPPDPQDKAFLESGVKHFNIYDGDEYDVMTTDNPNCIIKQGKGFPNAPKDLGELLDDKRDLAEIRHRYQEYSLVAEDESKEYDDEYDDSYEALLESETRTVKPKELKNVLADVDDVSDDESEESDHDGEARDNTATKSDRRLNFCENPEDIRARYEARQQAKWGNRNDNRNRDVVGAQKGQGQSKETLMSRSKKEKTKSSRANHNRKAGAAYKRSKGMLS